MTGICASFTLESVKLEANLLVLKRTISGKHTNGVLWDRGSITDARTADVIFRLI